MEGCLERAGLKATVPNKCSGRWWYQKYLVDHKRSFIQCFTDGSLLWGRACWGYLVWDGCVEHRGKGGLGTRSSVFQAKLTMIIRVALLLKHWHSAKRVFFVDSQASLCALDSMEFSSQLVRECIQSLEKLATHNKVILQWVKVHVDRELDEETDTSTKKGATTESVDTPPNLKVVKNLIEIFFHNRWSSRWKQLNSCRQAKFWISELGILGKQIFRWVTQSTVIQALTGHNYLNYHCSKVNRSHAETISVGRNTRSLSTSCASVPHSPGRNLLVFMTSNLTLLPTLLALSDSREWVALPRLWKEGQIKLRMDACAPQMAIKCMVAIWG